MALARVTSTSFAVRSRRPSGAADVVDPELGMSA
eukprot:CAMPEP_0114676060 /NCGR_PEP_ID=MMETSP0191-20121206/48733_1 /TAXON_ID=126664 /ORGANISM="Sorites sp." /LENGTH=33 /DNA_ID= /DNA_START= /DNA_END= /DNA_ORIENTATION=